MENTVIPRSPLRKGYDIGKTNLFASLGLPGADEPDVEYCLDFLDHAAECVGRKTTERMPEFQEDGGQWNYHEPVFRMAVLSETLTQDLGIKYNLPTMDLDDQTWGRDPRNMFIHGIIEGDGGTCASLPVFYIAVGRRLGYPLKLVHTQRHSFARWQGGVRFNIECTAPEFRTHSNEYYLQWPDRIPLSEAIRMGLLQSQTPKQELQWFIRQRARVFLHHGMLKEAVQAFEEAYRTIPDPLCLKTLEHLRECLRDGKPWNDFWKPLPA